MDCEQITHDAIARIEQADAEAVESMTAFASGRFEELWLRKAAEVAERLGVQSGDGSSGASTTTNADRGGSGENRGGGAGAAYSSGSGGP